MNDDSFFSMNRLMEFSMGLAIAQQMTQAMNHAICQMTVPGAGNPMLEQSSKALYVVVDGNRIGPLTDKDFMQLVGESKITESSLAWMPGMISWQAIKQIPYALKILTLTPPPIPDCK